MCYRKVMIAWVALSIHLDGDCSIHSCHWVIVVKQLCITFWKSHLKEKKSSWLGWLRLNYLDVSAAAIKAQGREHSCFEAEGNRRYAPTLDTSGAWGKNLKQNFRSLLAQELGMGTFNAGTTCVVSCHAFWIFTGVCLEFLMLCLSYLFARIPPREEVQWRLKGPRKREESIWITDLT